MLLKSIKGSWQQNTTQDKIMMAKFNYLLQEVPSQKLSGDGGETWGELKESNDW